MVAHNVLHENCIAHLMTSVFVHNVTLQIARTFCLVTIESGVLEMQEKQNILIKTIDFDILLTLNNSIFNNIHKTKAYNIMKKFQLHVV